MNKLTIIGLGLIGNSIGMALRRALVQESQPAQANSGKNSQKAPEPAFEVVGLDPERQNEADALRKYYSVDSIAHSLEQAVDGAGLVIIATPLEAVREVMQAIEPYLSEGAVVTDVHASKEQVMRWAEEMLGRQANFVGGHPILISSGPDARTDMTTPSADLFKNVRWAIIPGRGADDDALNSVIWLAETVGANPLFIDALEHDSFLSAVSHLPVMASAALWQILNSSPGWDDMQPFAQSGIRGVTEPLSAPPEIITSALAGNRQVLIGWLDRYITALYDMRDSLARHDAEQEGARHPLASALTEAHRSRAAWMEDSSISTEQKDAMRRAQVREEINESRPGRNMMGSYLSDRIFKKKDK